MDTRTPLGTEAAPERGTDCTRRRPQPIPSQEKQQAYLRELPISKPLHPSHARDRLALGRGSVGDDNRRPPGETFDLPPDEFPNSKFLPILKAKDRTDKQKSKHPPMPYPHMPPALCRAWHAGARCLLRPARRPGTRSRACPLLPALPGSLQAAQSPFLQSPFLRSHKPGARKNSSFATNGLHSPSKGKGQGKGAAAPKQHGHSLLNPSPITVMFVQTNSAPELQCMAHVTGDAAGPTWLQGLGVLWAPEQPRAPWLSRAPLDGATKQPQGGDSPPPLLLSKQNRKQGRAKTKRSAGEVGETMPRAPELQPSREHTDSAGAGSPAQELSAPWSFVLQLGT